MLRERSAVAESQLLRESAAAAEIQVLKERVRMVRTWPTGGYRVKRLIRFRKRTPSQTPNLNPSTLHISHSTLHPPSSILNPPSNLPPKRSRDTNDQQTRITVLGS